jgi:curved DNA-binding protein CbpA
MGSFIQSLKSQVEKALGKTLPWGENANPLVVIGLTEAILDLGLTEDQIYAVIHSYGRQLAAQVHPDRQPENVSAERQRQILGAFDLIGDRDHFAQALSDFRTLRAEDRREIKILLQAISSLKKQNEDYRSQFAKFLADRTQLDEDLARFVVAQEEFQKYRAKKLHVLNLSEKRIERIVEENASRMRRIKRLERELLEAKKTTRSVNGLYKVAEKELQKLKRLLLVSEKRLSKRQSVVENLRRRAKTWMEKARLYAKRSQQH